MISVVAPKTTEFVPFREWKKSSAMSVKISGAEREWSTLISGNMVQASASGMRSASEYYFMLFGYC